MTKKPMKLMGRLVRKDERDQGFPMQSLIPAEADKEEKTYKYWWAEGWWGDQGVTPMCVSFSWMHWVEDGPVTHFYEDREHDPSYMKTSTKALFSPVDVYNEAQTLDPWPGTSYDGTSVRAGAKSLMRRGVIEEYRWAWDVDTVIQALLHVGPVVVGTWWYDQMFYPDEDGLIKAEGRKIGGHAYLLNGVNTETGLIRIKNSWGQGWGENGHAYISIEDMDKLIKDSGEACLATERKLK